MLEERTDCMCFSWQEEFEQCHLAIAIENATSLAFEDNVGWITGNKVQFFNHCLTFSIRLAKLWKREMHRKRSAL